MKKSEQSQLWFGWIRLMAPGQDRPAHWPSELEWMVPRASTRPTQGELTLAMLSTKTVAASDL